MKGVRFLILALALLVFLAGVSSPVLRWFYEVGLVADDYRYGDLYRLANLPQFKAREQPCPPGHPANAPRLPIDLYLIGDSFTEPERIGPGDFPVQRYHNTHWAKQSAIQLDPNRTNVLILETVERHFREHFAQAVLNLRVVADTTRLPAPPAEKPNWATRIHGLEETIAPPGTEERLENLLFSNDFFLWFKELKASLNLRWFDRTNPKVSLVGGGNQLVYALDTDSTAIHASFTPLSDRELNSLVDSVNQVAERYRRLGFDQVYLSIIPNKVSLVDPQYGTYNRLIERVQQHPALRVPVIDAYTPMRESREPVYAPSDSHWNCRGRAIWLEAVNRQLRTPGGSPGPAVSRR